MKEDTSWGKLFGWGYEGEFVKWIFWREKKFLMLFYKYLIKNQKTIFKFDKNALMTFDRHSILKSVNMKKFKAIEVA
jgi:ABC-type antimicrobial peptide transport system ATPase subunit